MQGEIGELARRLCYILTPRGSAKCAIPASDHHRLSSVEGAFLKHTMASMCVRSAPDVLAYSRKEVHAFVFSLERYVHIHYERQASAVRN
jgi:hypothetical protein